MNVAFKINKTQLFKLLKSIIMHPSSDEAITIEPLYVLHKNNNAIFYFSLSYK